MSAVSYVSNWINELYEFEKDMYYNIINNAYRAALNNNKFTTKYQFMLKALEQDKEDEMQYQQCLDECCDEFYCDKFYDHNAYICEDENYRYNDNDTKYRQKLRQYDKKKKLQYLNKKHNK